MSGGTSGSREHRSAFATTAGGSGRRSVLGASASAPAPAGEGRWRGFRRRTTRFVDGRRGDDDD
ncbi:MAG: hypothetical protein FWD42_05530, partial [Solirubrobacterales bacterium]|nr:hypothetical protein [Solirubrobacterales bacterium]